MPQTEADEVLETLSLIAGGIGDGIAPSHPCPVCRGRGFLETHIGVTGLFQWFERWQKERQT